MPIAPLPTRDGETFPRERCTQCGCEWLCPPPSRERLAQAYAADYYGEGASKFPGPVERVIQWFRDGRARAAARLIGKTGAVLDIGCGNGGFLRSLSKLGSYKLNGIELPGPAADRASTVPGIRLIRRPLQPDDFQEGSLDLVTLFHVIEHLDAPDSVLYSVSRILKPGGKLVVSLPNCDSLQARLCDRHWLHWDPPRHLWLAPPSAVVQAAARHGFKVVSCSHLSLEQNPFGLLQGLLNHWFPRDRLYDWLKNSKPGAGGSIPWPELLISFLILGIPCVLFSLFETAIRRGGTFKLVFERA